MHFSIRMAMWLLSRIALAMCLIVMLLGRQALITH